MKRTALAALILISAFLPPIAVAADDPIVAHNKFVFTVTGRILVAAAEKMPEEHYGFRPADSVRTFGQIVGHVADSQYGFCAAARPNKNPLPNIEKTKTSKADLVAALKEAFAYCDATYSGVTEASSEEKVKLMGMEMPRLGVLTVNLVHTMEHYGNLVTYMRMKDVVPPTSDNEFMAKVAQ